MPENHASRCPAALALALLALAAAACLCQYDPFADSYTTKEPASGDVVGTYVLTHQTLTETPVDQLAARDGTHPRVFELVLTANGVFTATNLPVWVDDWSDGANEWSIREFVSVSGGWRIDTVGSIGDGSGKTKHAWGVVLYGEAVPDVHVTLSGTQAPYRLIFGYGDPDGGDAMIYEKQPPGRRARSSGGAAAVEQVDRAVLARAFRGAL
jgi:hypothetical protein